VSPPLDTFQKRTKRKKKRKKEEEGKQRKMRGLIATTPSVGGWQMANPPFFSLVFFSISMFSSCFVLVFSFLFFSSFFFFFFFNFLPCVKLRWHFCTSGAILLGLMWFYAYVSQFLLKTLMASVWREWFDNKAYLNKWFDKF